MKPFAKPSLLGVGAAAAIAALATPAWGTSSAPTATAARLVGVRDEGYLRFIRSSGSQIIDEGPVYGTIRGWARVRFTYNGSPSVAAQFTLYGSGGSISGYASGRLNNPNSTSPSFRGHMSLSGGRGRYAHAQGSGELFGVFFRRNYALTVQTLGRLRY